MAPGQPASKIGIEGKIDGTREELAVLRLGNGFARDLKIGFLRKAHGQASHSHHILSRRLRGSISAQGDQDSTDPRVVEASAWRTSL
jgi:hypothetical protein